MQMSGEQRVDAPRRRVWEALNDPAVLARCIPGCQSLENDGDNRFVAVAEVKIGPIGARFKGNVKLSDLDPPNGYAITGSGSGGIAGPAKGSARVRLSDVAGGGTLVSYDVDVEVGGRMAQLGGTIIDATARNLAGKFFGKFGEIVSGGVTAQASSSAEASGTVPAPADVPPVAAYSAHSSSVPAPLWGWVAALVLAIVTGFIVGRDAYHGVVALAVTILVIVTGAAAYEAGRRSSRR